MQGRIIAVLSGALAPGRWLVLCISMFLCKNVNMRTSLDIPDPLFKHLKTRAAQEGRTLRDLVIELVERGLSAREVVDPQKRFQARPPVIPNQGPLPLDLGKWTNADLYELINEEDDERTIRPLGRG